MRAIWRGLRVVAHLSLGIVVTSILRIFYGQYWYASDFGRDVVLWWTRKVNRIVGIRIVKYGEPPLPHALYVANHISFFDIIVISAITPTTFISKNAVRYWPLVGQLSSLAGVVFIKRGKRSLIARIIETAARALNSGGSLTVFPEGTTHFSNEPKKFHSGLFQAAIDSQTPIQAIALAYIRDGGHDRAAAYVEGDNLLLTLFLIMARPHTNVHVSFCTATKPDSGDRNTLAQHTRQQIIDARNNKLFVETH
ncbi:1-acyl-sn-glycerol-3-phosphate acyltransferase [hydrothermal vent metagenome]|uniref:1-acyl-sn-glycerol-3-phosphate acyltransferase n=1 Tax=hydrothermal vent metagenome TaxID=652676 RepID=A0A3B1AI81_9ZZZZ